MSLKARIEAVIYAAEEPVTLAQIAALFQAELLDERASRLAAQPNPSAEPDPQPDPQADPEAAAPAESTLALEPAGPAEESSAEAAAPELSSEDAEKRAAEELKRAARQQERDARDEARRLIAELITEYDQAERGIEIREIAGGYRLGTKPEYHDAVRAFVKSLKPPMKLSLQALETLAVIAYKQPVTAPEISEIRGVDSAGVLGSLISRKLVATAGRKQVIGRPILYKTTKEFLLRFGLKDLNELPSMEEFEKMAGELADTEDAASATELPFDGVNASAEPGASVTTSPEADPEADTEAASQADPALEADAVPAAEPAAPHQPAPEGTE